MGRGAWRVTIHRLQRVRLEVTEHTLTAIVNGNTLDFRDSSMLGKGEIQLDILS